MASSTVQVNYIAASPHLDSINLFNSHCPSLSNSETGTKFVLKLPDCLIFFRKLKHWFSDSSHQSLIVSLLVCLLCDSIVARLGMVVAIYACRLWCV